MLAMGGGECCSRVHQTMFDDFPSNLGGVMPETTTTRAWRADSMEGRAKSTAVARPGSRPACEGRAVELEESGTGASRLRRLGAAVARAAVAAWWRAFHRPAIQFEEALHGFAAELAATNEPQAIESALLRFARWVATPAGLELIRATGEPGGRRDESSSKGGAGTAARRGDGEPRPDESCAEIPVRCGAAKHGTLLVRTPAGLDDPVRRHETRRRLALACTLAASALETARQQAEWSCGETADENEDARPDGTNGPRPMRIACKQPDIVHDATFLNAVLPFALAQARRHGEPLSLMCLQLDRLGAIRNLLGPEIVAGLVHDLAATVASLVRSSDIVARLDDDRIVALLVRARGDNAIRVARTIGRAVAESGLGSPRLPGASASIGVAEFPAAAFDAASLLDAADEAMCRARAEGSQTPRLAGPRAAGDSDTEARPAMASARA